MINDNDWKFIEEVYEEFLVYVGVLERVEIKEGLKIAMSISGMVNKYIQDGKPWETKEFSRLI